MAQDGGLGNRIERMANSLKMSEIELQAHCGFDRHIKESANEFMYCQMDELSLNK